MPFSGNSNLAWFIDQVDTNIVRAMQPNIIHEKLSRKVAVSKGNTREYNQTTQDFPLSMTQVSEGGEFLSGTVDLDRKVIAFAEKGITARISKRMIEDAEWDQVQIHLEEAGKAAARTLNRDCLETIRANVPSSSPNNVVTATAAWSAVGADPVRDVSLALEKLEENNYENGTVYLAINPLPGSYLRLDPNVSRVMNYGDPTVLKKNIQPQLFDVQILRTTDLKSGNTGWANLSNNFALMVNADWALNFYERQALKTEQVDVPKQRSIDIVAYMRYAFVAVRPNALARISTVV